MRTLHRLVMLLAFIAAATTAHAQEQIAIRSSRPGVAETIYLHPASHAVASAILFPGGAGAVDGARNNFLIRSADDFAAAGITVAVADTPSDQPGGMSPAFRASDAQAADTAAIVAFLRDRTHLPVWLVGTSNGTISAANAGVRLGPPQIAGVVLTSSVWAGGMPATHFETLRVPTLIVHNRNDGCRSSPFDQAAPALESLRDAPARQLIVVASGSSLSAPCQAMSAHGYLHIEGQVVSQIAGWIKTH